MKREATRKRPMRATRRQRCSGRGRDEIVETIRLELRTRLTAIAGSLGLLIGGAAGQMPASATRFLQIAHDKSQRLAALIDDALDIGSIQTRKYAGDAAGGSVRLPAVVGRRLRVLHVDDDPDVLH